ncbi:MAG TPA: amidohydrolase family protein [Candidatus Polarisedimenticolaceae bacterium]|nr:amidohydrolase family protein [Candidatus Polarisedimenticolaceae bacterium]
MRSTPLLLLLLAAPALCADEAKDLDAARAVFKTNIEAIQQRDRERYLACYLRDPHLARVGPAGFVTGFDGFAEQAGAHWPDLLEASDLHLVRVRPGIVYGTYRYRVRYGDDEHQGISERLFVATPQGFKIAVTGAIDVPPGTPPPPRALVGATLIDGRGGAPLPNATIVLRDGKIDCAGRCELPEGIEITDVRGSWITPGLIDAHVHFSQTGWADGRPDALDLRAKYPYERTQAELRAAPERFGRSYVCSGVTAVWDVGGYAWTTALGARFESDTRLPHVVAAGPLLSTLDHWLNLPAERQFMLLDSDEAARRGVRYLAAIGAQAVKVWYIVRPPDLTVEKNEANVAAAADEAHRLGLPLIVHATGLAEAKASLRAGANVLVHSVEDLPLDAEFLELAKKNGTIVIPTLTVLDGYARMFQGVAARQAPPVDDPGHCVDRATLDRVAETATVDPALFPAERLAAVEERARRFASVTRANLKTLVENGIPIASGTDAGNPLTLHGPAIHAEIEAMQAAGMTPMQVIVASTATAARAMGLGARIGTIEPGKEADLLVIGADPTADVANFRQLRSVVRGGVLRSVGDLSAQAQR